jgi:DNA-binding transcriptional LysR family regulator
VRFLALRYFNEVAKLGSIRKAADRLHVAPSAVSRQIAQLEREVDAVLFERSKVGVQLTAAGEVLARQSHRIFRDLDRARSGIDDLRGLQRGDVSVWVIEGFVSGLLPDILANFHHQYPGVSFKIQTGSTDRIVEALLEDEADIGITFNAMPRAEIEVIAEYVEPISCLVAPTHDYANRSELTLDEICKYHLALPEHSFGLRQVFERAIAKRRLNPQILVTTNSLELPWPRPVRSLPSCRRRR